MRRKLIAVVASLLIMAASISASEPRCWATDDICQTRADNTWNSCRADGGWYITCYIVYSATYDECMSASQCDGQARPKAQ